MSGFIGVEVEALAGIGIAVAGVLAVAHITAAIKATGVGGPNSPVNQNPPDTTGTHQSPPFGNAMASCEGPFFAPGTTKGKQVFLAQNTRPSCSGFTFANFLYTQQGYFDPSSGLPVDDGVNYQVWRCLNQLTHIDDGWFYLSPNCVQ